MGYLPQIDADHDHRYRSRPTTDDVCVTVDGTVDEHDIVEGDLVFTSRPGLLQDLCNRAGEPWRHVGVATVHDGAVSITEVSRNRFDIRPMSRVIASNDEVAIARVEPAARVRAAAAARWCRRHGRTEQLYAWHDVMLAGMIATARHYTVQVEREALHRAIEAAAGVVGLQRPTTGATSYTCAAFVAEAFARSGHPIDIELRLPRADDQRPAIVELIKGRSRPQLRAGRPTTREFAIVLYALLAGMIAATSGRDGETAELDQFRWAMPGDLWRSPSILERFMVLPTAPADGKPSEVLE
jgi:hypothetical protein